MTNSQLTAENTLYSLHYKNITGCKTLIQPCLEGMAIDVQVSIIENED